MRVVIHSSYLMSGAKVLITGIRGFTGVHLKEKLVKAGYAVYGLVNGAVQNSNEFSCDITNYEEVCSALSKVKPDYIIHLAAISFVPYGNIEAIYQVNLFGTCNILRALDELNIKPRKILIASSANVYGNPKLDVINESCCPLPVNDYANSKLAMENVARIYFDKFPIVITRPFNYTGIGQEQHFLIPKIVAHYKCKANTIELGNVDIVRDFSDVEFVVSAYHKLIESNACSVIVNICSGKGYSIKDIISCMNKLAGYEMRIQVNPEFVRENEIKCLVGSNELLFELIGRQAIYSLPEILSEIYFN